MMGVRLEELVVPRVGTWVEIALRAMTKIVYAGRPPRGDVG